LEFGIRIEVYTAMQEIEGLPLFDGDLKQRLKLTVTDGCGCSTIVNAAAPEVAMTAMQILNSVEGIIPAHHRDFNSSQVAFALRDGSQVKTWKSPIGMDHIFLADPEGKMIYGGYVYWFGSEALNQAIQRIQQELTDIEEV